MPTDLTDATTFDAHVTVPNGGEPRTAAGVRVGYQDLADRTAYLNDLVQGATGGGVRRLRNVAGPSALALVTDQNDGDLASASGAGIYKFVASGSPPAYPSPQNVAAAGGTPGHWYLLGVGIAAIGTNNGVAGLDGAGKLAAAAVPNAVAGSSYAAAPDGTQVLGAVGAITAPTLPLVLQTGDVVHIDGALRVALTIGSAVVRFDLRANGAALASVSATTTSDEAYLALGGARYVAVANGVVTFDFAVGASTTPSPGFINLLNGAVGGSDYAGRATLRALVIRP